jgi:hypothetical protein
MMTSSQVHGGAMVLCLICPVVVTPLGGDLKGIVRVHRLLHPITSINGGQAEPHLAFRLKSLSHLHLSASGRDSLRRSLVLQMLRTHGREAAVSNHRTSLLPAGLAVASADLREAHRGNQENRLRLRLLMSPITGEAPDLHVSVANPVSGPGCLPYKTHVSLHQRRGRLRPHHKWVGANLNCSLVAARLLCRRLYLHLA